MLYEQYQDRLKLCALCNNRINKTHVVCEDHLADMEKYRHEEWFITLCQMQQRQYEIDVEEYRIIKHGFPISTLQKSSRTRGKQLTNQQKKDILYLYNHGLGDRRIAKQLKIPYSAVNKLLYRYRKYNRSARQL